MKEFYKLTAAKAAELVEKASPQELKLDHIAELEDGAAEVLAKYKGQWLELNGLTTLTDEDAEALGQYKGIWLHLSGLTTLSDKATGALAKFGDKSRENPMSIDELYLNSLTTLTAKSAEALGKCGVDSLHLMGVTTLPDRAIVALAKFAPENPLPIDCRTDALFLGLTTLSNMGAKALGQFKGAYLYLNDSLTGSDEAAAALAIYEGCLQWLGHENDRRIQVKMGLTSSI